MEREKRNEAVDRRIDFIEWKDKNKGISIQRYIFYQYRQTGRQRDRQILRDNFNQYRKKERRAKEKESEHSQIQK